jgi:hypothetical protein
MGVVGLDDNVSIISVLQYRTREVIDERVLQEPTVGSIKDHLLEKISHKD